MYSQEMHILFIHNRSHDDTRVYQRDAAIFFLFKPLLLQIISVFISLPPVFQSLCYIYNVEIKESPSSSMYGQLANIPGWLINEETKNKVYVFI